METKRSIALAEPSKEAPELRRLGIPNAELAVLARQGRLQFDQRARAKSGYWRLRFRFQGRTRTVYLGTNTVLISAVQRELQVLRAPRLATRKLTQAAATAKKHLAVVKAQYRGELATRGYYFHGGSLRRRRSPLAEA